MATLRVGCMDETLYAALAARAARDNRSVQEEVVTIIRDFLAQPAHDHKAATEALLQLAGAWQDNRTAGQIASDLRKSRRWSRRDCYFRR
jgi:plasmid stability protein